jgi:hypothetical protein
MTKVVLSLLLSFLYSYAYTQNTEVELQYVEENDSIIFQVKSSAIIPIDVVSKQVDSLFPKVVYKELVTVQPYDSVRGFIRVHIHDFERLKQARRERAIYTVEAHYGDRRNAKHDSTYLYALPYEKGKKVQVEQTFFGKSSHKTIASRYAIDFGMRTGEKVYAAREGIVVFALDHFTEGGKRKELTRKANKIVILHTDGTLGAYAHLMHKGTLVKKGDSITKGQHIGYSGNTGYSGGPHLHFVVREPGDISVPIYFEDYEGLVLKRGKRYKRKH